MLPRSGWVGTIHAVVAGGPRGVLFSDRASRSTIVEPSREGVNAFLRHRHHRSLGTIFQGSWSLRIHIHPEQGVELDSPPEWLASPRLPSGPVKGNPMCTISPEITLGRTREDPRGPEGRRGEARGGGPLGCVGSRAPRLPAREVSEFTCIKPSHSRYDMVRRLDIPSSMSSSSKSISLATWPCHGATRPELEWYG